MNIIKEINKITNLTILREIIEKYNYGTESNFILENNKMKLSLEESITQIFEEIYIPLNLHKKNKIKILDIGSGFCHNNLICKALGHECHNIEKPSREDVTGYESNLYGHFHKILNLKNVEYYEIKGPEIKLKNKNRYDFIFILNPTFNEQEKNDELYLWGIEEWKKCFKRLHNNLTEEGKIIIGWGKGSISDDSFLNNWNKYKNNKVLKHIQNKNVDFFRKNVEYKVFTRFCLKA